MIKSHIFMTTSCKGGVGKSTIAANTALCLAKLGKKVLLIDLDLGMPCLDIILGVENSVLFTLGDFVNAKRNNDTDFDIKNMLIKDRRSDNLFFCASPQIICDITSAELEAFIDEASELLGCDYVIVDTPGDEGPSFVLATQVCRNAIIVATHAPTSLRAAERTSLHLSERGIDCKLVINEFDLGDLDSLKGKDRTSVVEMIDQAHVRLLGIVPYSYELARGSEQGILCDKVGGYPLLAFRNIARRIDNQNVRLFDGFSGRKKIRKAI